MGIATAVNKAQQYFPTLDGWRAIAIIPVLLDHSAHTVLLNGVVPDRHYWGALGSNGVTIFFVLSGFLITSRLMEEERGFGRISLSKFYLRRAFRILPI